MPKVVNSCKTIYSSVYNLFLDSPITEEDANNLTGLFSTQNCIKQIYMKDDVDIESIKIIKYLIEISSNTVDSDIEKYVLGTKASLIDLCSLRYQNPSSWQVSYENIDNKYKVTSIPKCRKMINLCNEIKRDIERFSSLEKVIYIYHHLKDYKLGEVKEDLIPEIIDSNVASESGLNILFSYLLKDNGISSYNFYFKGYVATMVYIKDEQNDIDGYYFFVPIDAKKEEFECFTLDEIKAKSNHLVEALKLPLSSSIGLIRLLNEKYKINYFKDLESVFSDDYSNIYEKLHSSKKIDVELLKSIYKEVINLSKDSVLSLRLKKS